LKKTDLKGDLYLVVKIEFPDNGWLEDPVVFGELQKILPGPPPAVEATEVDEVEYDSDADIEDVSFSLGYSNHYC
jgi:DnaJ family protein A protein 2